MLKLILLNLLVFSVWADSRKPILTEFQQEILLSFDQNLHIKNWLFLKNLFFKIYPEILLFVKRQSKSYKYSNFIPENELADNMVQYNEWYIRNPGYDHKIVENFAHPKTMALLLGENVNNTVNLIFRVSKLKGAEGSGVANGSTRPASRAGPRLFGGPPRPEKN